MAEKEYYTYEELSPKEKENQTNKALQWLVAGPKFITEIQTEQEFIDKVVEFSKILYARFPKEKGGGGQQVQMIGL